MLKFQRATALVLGLFGFLAMTASPRAQMTAGSTPKAGEKAHDFSLASLNGPQVRLADEVRRGPVVLVVLRGWNGYQCPYCTRQFGEFVGKAAEFQARNAQVLFVYPGPDAGGGKVKEFAAKTEMPPNFRMLIDPDFTFTNAYGLRWDAPKETAYPSTFVLDKKGVVTFAATSHAHGDRVPVATVLKALTELE